MERKLHDLPWFHSPPFMTPFRGYDFFQLTLRGFIIVYSFCDSCCALINESKTLNNSIVGKILPSFAIGNIRFFIGFFFFVFMPIPIFVLVFIAAQIYAQINAVTAALSSRVESFAVIRFRASSASILSTSFREIFAPRISYVMFATRHINGLMPWSSLANLF